MALQQLHEKFQPTALQDTETMAYVPVVGAFRIKLTDTVLLDVAMDDSVSGALAPPAWKLPATLTGSKYPSGCLCAPRPPHTWSSGTQT